MSDPALEKLLASLQVRDPLGEISARARELWQQAGSPADRTWQTFLNQAESDLMAGRGSAPKPQVPQNVVSKPASPYHIHLTQYRQSTQGLAKVLATAFDNPLNDHEVVCLVRILNTHQIVLTSGKSSPPTPASIDEALRLVTPLTCDYPAAFLSEYKTSDPFMVPEAKRIAFWRAIIEQQAELDSPLTAADRNTLHRLASTISSQPLIASITNQEL